MKAMLHHGQTIEQTGNSPEYRQLLFNIGMLIDRGFAHIALIGMAWLFLYPPASLHAQTPSTLACDVSVDARLAVVVLPDSLESRYSDPQQAPPAAATKPSATEDSSDAGKQTKRILGVMPNFRSVSVNTYLPAQSPKEKFMGFAEDSFDYSSFVFIGILSGVSQLQGATPEFHTGAPAYARYYWHNYADQTDENLWVDFLLPVALHQDARFYTMGRGTADKHNGVLKRTGYAFTRLLVTRTDSGGSAFNFSEVAGSGAAAGISNLYYPSSDRGWTKTGQRWALNAGLDGLTIIFKEFWPDINHAIFHSK
jgi:hypothetical protein